MSNVYQLSAAFSSPAPEESAEGAEGGYIKLFRSLQDCAFAGRPEYLSAWVHILMLASHKPRKTMIGKKPITLQSGQFVSGRKALAQRVGVTEKQMRGILDFFESEGMISKSSSRLGTIFTVCEYSVFQEKKGQEGPTVSGQQKGQGKPSNGAPLREVAANKEANKGPTKRATTQEHNNKNINTYGSSDDDPSVKPSRDNYPDEFQWIWSNRPRRSGPDPKKKAFQACKARIRGGATWRELAEGMKRYAKHCKDSGKLNTQFTMQMATFFGPDELYLTDDFGTDQRGTNHPRAASGPDWDDTSWADDLGGL